MAWGNVRDTLKKEKDTLYRDMLKKALEDTKRFARQGVQQTRSAANAVTGDTMTALKPGDLNNWNWSTSRQTVLDKAQAADYLSETGIFNSPEYALNSQYSGLSGLEYMKELLGQKQMELANSMVQDAAWADGGESAWYDFQTRKSAVKNKLADMDAQGRNYYDTDALEEADLLWFDKVVNGNESWKPNYASQQDVDRYNSLVDQWAEIDWDEFDLAKYLGIDAPKKYESLTPGLQADVDYLTQTIGKRETLANLESAAKADPRYAEMSGYTGSGLVLGENEKFMHSNPSFFINNANVDEQTFNQATWGTRTNWATRDVEQYHSPYLDLGYHYLTDDEIAVYNYYYNTDQGKAAEYLDALQGELLSRRATSDRAFWETLATNKGTGWLAWLMARGSDVLNVEDKLQQTAATIMGTADPNASYYDAANMKRYVDEANLRELGKNETLNKFMFGGKNIAQHGYSAFTGLVDSALPMVIDLMYGGGGKINQLLMAGQAYSGGLQEGAERELSAGQTLLTGGVNALIGYLTEKMGAEPDVMTGKNNVWRSFISEGSEELVDAIGSTAADDVLSELFGTKSAFENQVEALRQAGVENPEKEAVKLKLEEIATAFVYGGVAGAGMGAPGNIASYATNRATGKAVSTQGDVNALLEVAASMDPTTRSYQLAEKLNQRKEKGKKMPLSMLGELTQQLEADLGEEQSRVVNQVMDEAIEQRLVELGTDEKTAKKNAPAVRKVSRGQDPSLIEQAAVRWDNNASQVVRELAAKESTGKTRFAVEGAPVAEPEGQRAGQKWKSKMATRAIEASMEVTGKRLELRDAVSKPVDSAAQAAADKADKKVSEKNKRDKNLTVKAVAYATEEGEQKGEFQRFEMKDGQVKVVVKTGDKEVTVATGDMTDLGGAGTAAIIEYTDEAKHNMSADEANTMMSIYQKTGGDVRRFITNFEAVYAAGFAGIDAPATSLPAEVASAVYEQAKAEGEKEETQRVSKAKRLRGTVRGSVAWLGQVEDNSAIRGAGDKAALSEAMEGMTESQRSTVEVVQAMAEELRVNIVLYESTGKNIDKTANGKYDSGTHTLYIDVNSGASSEAGVKSGKKTNTLGYAMMRTLGHELTHHMESTSAEGYAQYKAAVKKQLQENGQSWAELVRGKIESAAAEGRKLTRMGAEAEVVADASEYMLQESSFTKKLDSGLYAKVKNFVQSFMEKVKEIFTHITGEHRESAALRRVIDGVKQYTGNLQELWDASLGETIQGESAMSDQGGDVAEAVEDMELMEQFSTRDIPHDETVLDKNKTTVQSMKTVARLVGNEFVMGKQLVKDVAEYYASIGGYSESPIFGRIDLNKRSVKDSVGHGMGPVKAVMYKAVPDVIAMGEMVDYRENWKGRGYDTAMIAAPVEIAEGEHKGQYYLGVIVNLYPDNRQRFYVHEAVVVQKKSVPVVQTGTPEGALHGNKDRSFISILEDLNIVNGENQEQYSTRDLPDAITIREYLGTMKPTSRMTETEKDLLGRYQKKLVELQEKERLAAEQDAILKEAHGDELLKAKNRYQVYRQQANRIARELARLERAEGFAGIMATSQTIVNEYLSGATGSVADAQDALETEIKGLTDRMKVIGNTLEGTAQGQRNAFARGLFNQTELNRAAKQLKDSYNSRMSVKAIADRLALTYGEIYASEDAVGVKRFAAAAKELAQDILDSSRYRYRSERLTAIAEEVPTISLSETDVQEIRNAGLTIAQYKRGISPYVKVVDGASDLSSYVTSAESYGGQIARILGDDTEGNLAMALYNVIQAERAEETTATLEGMSEGESLGAVLADVVSVNLPMSTSDTTMEYLRKELKKYAGENEQAAQSVDEAIKAAKGATARASAVWREAVKAQGIAHQAVEYYRALEEQRRLIELQEQKEMLTEQLKSDAAKKLAEKVEAQRTEYREREQKARAYRQSRDEVNKLRRGIGRKVKRLNALRIRETDQKHVPDELKPVVDLVMTVFTENSISKLAFSEKQVMRLIRAYDALREIDIDEAWRWDDEVSQMLKDLVELVDNYNVLTVSPGGKTLSYYFTVEGVEEERSILTGVEAIVSNVLKMVDDANEAFLKNRNETFDAFATQTGEDLIHHEDAKIRKGKLGDVQMAVDELLRTGNMTPIYFFEHLKNGRIMEVFDQIRRAQTEYARIIQECQAFVQQAKEKHHYGSWTGDAKLEMKTSQGHQITLSREQAMWAYATAKREKSNKLYQTEHLLVGGFQYKDTADTGEGKFRATDKPHSLDTADIAKIENWLTAEQKAYADEVVGFLSTTMADYGNDASMEMFGYKKFLESYYFPFQTAAAQRFQRGDEGASGDNAGTGRVKNSGFTKKLQHKANTTLVMDDFTTVAVDHMQKMATYAAMVQPIENMKRLMNHKVIEEDGTINTIRALIGQKYGMPAQKYLQDFLKDLNGAAQGDNRATKGLDFFISAFKRGAVMASASVVLQQPTAIARAMAMVNPKYFVTNPFYRPGKGVWEEMMKHSGTAVIKDMGKFDVGLGLTASEYISDEHLKPWEAYRRLKAESKLKGGAEAYKRFMDWLTAAPGKADQWTWGLIWQAVKKEVAAQNPNMDTGSEAFLDLVGQRFDDVIDHTQVYDSVLNRSNLMRSRNALHKMATSFMSEPTLSINMLYNALTGEHSGKKRAVIIGSVMASQVLAGALAAVVQAWNDDDDERNWAEKYADRATGNIIDNVNPLSMIPYISDLMSLFEGYSVERPDMSVVNDILTYGKNYFKAFEDGGAPDWKQTENFIGTLANMLGLPAKNISREMRRTWNAITNTDWSAPNAGNVGRAAMENLGVFYNSKNSAYYERMVSAMLKGDKELAEDLRTYMLTSKMVSEDKLVDGLKDALKERFISGGLDEDAAIKYLQEIGAKDSAEDAYWEVDKWEYMRDTGNTAGSYRKYDDFHTAVETGEDLKKVIQTYLDNGVTARALADNIRDTYRNQYVNLYKTNKAEFTNLQSRILTAYQVLGYDRDKKLKDIQKWLEEP